MDYNRTLFPDVPSSSIAQPARPPGNAISVDALKMPPRAVLEFQQALKDYKAGNMKGSVAHLEKSLAICPEFPEAHNTLGVMYAQLNEAEKALEEFRKASALNPKLVSSVNNQSAILLLMRRYPEAESAARHALDLDPQHKSTRYLLGRILLTENQNTAETLELLRQSRNDFPPARLFLSQVLINRGEKEAALQELNAYLEIPNAPQKEIATKMISQLTAPPSLVLCLH
ncbi:MAG: tetratricopeptide repeat protein [Candidatus Acidiferrum sp.]